MAAKDAEGTVMVAAEEDEDLPPESEEDALALNAEELKFWVHQVVHDLLLMLLRECAKDCSSNPCRCQ